MLIQLRISHLKNMLLHQPYSGLSRKLILAFDVGTTCSGMSYCILHPGEVPKIEPVTRYPAQEHSGGNSKIPSVIYYDTTGTPRAIGAEARQDHIIERAEEEGWIKLERWKLHLRPKHLAASHITDNDIPSLPRGKNAVEVLSDFMQYLFRCARSHIEDTHASGPNLWRSFENHIEFVLTHPNGWEGPQQKQIRLAAVLGGLIPSTEEGMARVHLLTEGEASLHYCVANVLASDGLSGTPIVVSEDYEEEDFDNQTSQGVVVIDAGKETIDVSSYSMSLSPTLFEEIAVPECRLQGSVFVTRRAHSFLQEKLSGSRFGTPEIVQQMTDIFDNSTKLRFRTPDDPSYIRFGTTRDRDPQHDIRGGLLKLNGQDVAKLFEPSISNIIDAFETQRTAGTPITFVFFVGSFAASDWMFSELQIYFQSIDVGFSRPDNHCNKHVADGAVLYFIDRLVSSRVARYTYGTECSVPYSPFDTEHRARQKQVFRSVSGILTKEEREIRAMETVPREPAHSTRSYTTTVTAALRGRSFKEGVDTPARTPVRSDGGRALAYVDSSSSQFTGSPAIDSLRNNTHHAAREADGNMGRLHPCYTPHEQLLPPPPAATSHSRSSQEPEPGNQSMESEIEQLRKELVSAKEELDGLRRENKGLIDERQQVEAKLQDERNGVEKVIQEMKIAIERIHKAPVRS